MKKLPLPNFPAGYQNREARRSADARKRRFKFRNPKLPFGKHAAGRNCNAYLHINWYRRILKGMKSNFHAVDKFMSGKLDAFLDLTERQKKARDSILEDWIAMLSEDYKRDQDA